MNITTQQLEQKRAELEREHITFNIDRLEHSMLDRLDDTENHPTIRDEAIYYLDSEPLEAMDNVFYEQGQREILADLILETKKKAIKDSIPRIENMESPRTGHPVANQYIIMMDGMRIFQSYNAIIAVEDQEGKITLDGRYWNYSNTTSKYRNAFLKETKKDTEKKIKDGTYSLDNLN